MRYLLLGIIKLYWLVPPHKRRHCLFKCSCSRYVYAATQEKGLIAGLKAYRERYYQCRPNYAIYTSPDGKEWVVLNDKTVTERSKTRI